MIKFFHHLFNPHCPECKEEKVCISCESLKTENAHLLRQNEFLLSKLFTTPVVEERVEIPPQPLRKARLPFSVLAQKLEREDKAVADNNRRIRQEELDNRAESIKKLEDELGIDDAQESTGTKN